MADLVAVRATCAEYLFDPVAACPGPARVALAHNNKLLVYPAIPIRHRPRRHVWRIYGGCLKATTPSLVYALRISLSTPVLPLAILRRLVYVVHALRPMRNCPRRTSRGGISALLLVVLVARELQTDAGLYRNSMDASTH